VGRRDWSHQNAYRSHARPASPQKINGALHVDFDVVVNTSAS
jgi:hypothetical protein